MASRSGLRVTGVEDLVAALSNVGKTASSTTFSVMLAGAKRIQQRASAYAPVDEGNLEESIKIERVRSEQTGRTSIRVGVDEDHQLPSRPGKTVGAYAARMHEGTYNLGPKSLSKQQRLGVRVGRKFLERALNDEKRQLEAEMLIAIAQTIRRANARRRGK